MKGSSSAGSLVFSMGTDGKPDCKGLLVSFVRCNRACRSISCYTTPSIDDILCAFDALCFFSRLWAQLAGCCSVGNICECGTLPSVGTLLPYLFIPQMCCYLIVAVCYQWIIVGPGYNQRHPRRAMCRVAMYLCLLRRTKLSNISAQTRDQRQFGWPLDLRLDFLSPLRYR